jgi:hypothetical protein
MSIHWSVLTASLALIGGGIALLVTDTAAEVGSGLIGAGLGLLGPSAVGRSK